MARAATSGSVPPSREALRRGVAVALAEAEIARAPRERLRRDDQTPRDEYRKRAPDCSSALLSRASPALLPRGPAYGSYRASGFGRSWKWTILPLVPFPP